MFYTNLLLLTLFCNSLLIVDGYKIISDGYYRIYVSPTNVKELLQLRRGQIVKVKYDSAYKYQELIIRENINHTFTNLNQKLEISTYCKDRSKYIPPSQGEVLPLGIELDIQLYNNDDQLTVWNRFSTYNRESHTIQNSQETLDYYFNMMNRNNNNNRYSSSSSSSSYSSSSLMDYGNPFEGPTDTIESIYKSVNDSLADMIRKFDANVGYIITVILYIIALIVSVLYLLTWLYSIYYIVISYIFFSIPMSLSGFISTLSYELFIEPLNVLTDIIAQFENEILANTLCICISFLFIFLSLETGAKYKLKTVGYSFTGSILFYILSFSNLGYLCFRLGLYILIAGLCISCTKTVEIIVEKYSKYNSTFIALILTIITAYYCNFMMTTPFAILYAIVFILSLYIVTLTLRLILLWPLYGWSYILNLVMFQIFPVLLLLLALFELLPSTSWIGSYEIVDIFTMDFMNVVNPLRLADQTNSIYAITFVLTLGILIYMIRSLKPCLIRWNCCRWITHASTENDDTVTVLREATNKLFPSFEQFRDKYWKEQRKTI